ncbi:MAG: T9SS type A sorting domain-containing protein [Melioribacteraceae bacterium]|nr:T9SS type A sorting domain-containing protein [Melioribacteraceae bacterium]
MKVKYIFLLLMLTSLSYAGEKRVLVELLTNSHCPSCVSAYTALNSLLSTNSENVDVIFYHMPFPYSDDALYQANTSDATLRNNFYGPFSSTPRALFNGVLQSNSYSSWTTVLNNELSSEVSFGIELSGSIDGSNFSINSKITRLADTPESDLILNLVIVEDVLYAGRNGVSDHDNVMRSIGTGSNGIAVDLSLNESKDYIASLNFSDLWNTEAVSVVAFIQSKSSKKIYHSETIAYSNLGITDVEESETLPLSFELKQNYPNPFNPATVISYQLAVNSFVRLQVFNVLGKEIKTLVSQNQQPGDYKINFDASELSSGTYFYQLNTGGHTLTKKMLLIR